MRWLALGINGRTVDGRRVCIEREVSGIEGRWKAATQRNETALADPVAVKEKPRPPEGGGALQESLYVALGRRQLHCWLTWLRNS